MEFLQIGGVNCQDLVSEFGTPLYVYDESKIKSQATSAMRGFSSDQFETEVVYASKAFSSIALFKLLASNGIGFDVVSGGELYGVIKAGCDMNKVYFHGNNKSDDEIEMALDAGVGYFVVDNAAEINRLIAIADSKQKATKVLLRINPGISAHTHEYIMTATPDSKFGIHIKETELIQSVVQSMADSCYVKHAGFHSHIGSQIVDASSFERAVETMIGFLAEMKERMGIDNMEFSIGGGFGIKYVDEDNPASLEEMCAKLVQAAERASAEKGVNISKLITEPGRAMVGEAGYTLYTAGDMKVSGSRNYIFVDGGMSDNIRPALYDAEYSAVIANKMNQQPFETYCIAGKNCESGDVIIKSVKLPKAQRGDIIAVKSTGAYGYSMASNYNRLGRPAVVFTENGNVRQIIKRETYEDQYRLEI